MPYKAEEICIQDDTGVYKNLLQEISQRVGSSLPIYTTFRSGVGHLSVFSCTVELAGVRFTGEPAKNKKQAEKNAAMAAWSSLKLLAQQSESSSSQKVNKDVHEHVIIACSLQNFIRKAKMSNASFPIKFPTQSPRPLSTKPPPIRASKILPLIWSKTAPRSRPVITPINNNPIGPYAQGTSPETQPIITTANDAPLQSPEIPRVRPQQFHAAGAAPYIPVRHLRAHRGIAPPVTIRNAIPVFSTPPLPPPSQSPQLRSPLSFIAPSVCIRQTVPVFAAPPVRVGEQPVSTAPPTPQASSSVQIEKTGNSIQDNQSFMAPQLRSPLSFIAPSVCMRQTVPTFAVPPVRVEEQHVSTAPPTPQASSSVQIEKTENSIQDNQSFIAPQLRSPVVIYCPICLYKADSTNFCRSTSSCRKATCFYRSSHPTSQLLSADREDTEFHPGQPGKICGDTGLARAEDLIAG
ncbi:hypothetical protein HYC85_000747 [Camellia sinensis]|uniref:DRBM domain-containing protein n=1 Tax=Camellia sinensis TaxID=4442 RepID=A0A7J7I5X4_CAMSI|nr:hypothetical protein HYC85_000747 [Camellia sinensis]